MNTGEAKKAESALTDKELEIVAGGAPRRLDGDDVTKVIFDGNVGGSRENAEKITG